MIDNPFTPIYQKLDEILSILKNGEAIYETREPKEQIEIIDTKELLERLSISEPTLIRYKKKGKIPYIKIGGAIRYNWLEVVKELTINLKKKMNLIRVNVEDINHKYIGCIYVTPRYQWESEEDFKERVSQHVHHEFGYTNWAFYDIES